MAQVRNEQQAVETLRQAVNQYVSQLRSLMADTRKDLQAQERQAQVAVDTRRSELHKAQQQLAQARAALASCERGCGALIAAMNAAKAKVDSCQARLGAAQRAHQTVMSAGRDFARTAQSLDAITGQHGSVAQSALGELKRRLSAVTDGDTMRRVAKNTILTVQIAGALGGAVPVTANAVTALTGYDVPGRDQSTSEMQERQMEEGRDYVAEESQRAAERRSGLGGD